MPRIEFAGQSARDNATTAANPTRLINLYREPTGAGHVLRCVPGMEAWADIDTAIMRDMRVHKDALYIAAGGRLWELDEDGAATDCGAIGNSTQTGLSSNGELVVTVGRGQMRVWDGETLDEVTVAPFEDVGSVEFLGNYSLASQLRGKMWAWSELADARTWPGLNFTTASITDEEITRLVVLSDTVFVFGATSCERWALTGEANANAFARIGGGELDIGLPIYHCVTRFPGGFAFVGSNGTVNLWIGQVAPIGTPAVNAAIAAETPKSMIYYERGGHGFVALTFTSRPAWVYDMAMKEWHERAEGVDGAWRARVAAYYAGAWRVGTDLGKIAKLSDIRRDFDAPLLRRAVSARMDIDMKTLALVEAFPRKGLDDEDANAMQLYLETSGGAAVAEETTMPLLGETGWDSGAAQVGLRLSPDGGRSFGKLRLRDVGEIGDYAKRITWRALGQFRSVTLEFSLSSITEVPMETVVQVEVA